MKETNLDNLLEQAHHLLEKGQYEEGLKVFQQTDSEFPSVAKLKYGLGLAYFRLKQHEESIEYLNIALQLQQVYPLALVRRGMAYKALKQNELANADFTAVLQIEPQTNEDLRARGIALSTQVHLNLLLKILQTIANGVEKEQVYQLLQQNLHLINDNLVQALQTWANSTLPILEAEQKRSIGFIIGNFSILIKEFPLGNRACNIEIAITGNNILLTIYTQQDFPVEWAATHNNLGAVYSHRIKGDKADNIERAIASYERALIIYTQQDFPVEWATIHNNLGNVYSRRIKGDKADNIERAIASYERALIIRIQEDFPEKWAMTHNSLSAAYSHRIKGDKADNIETAISFCKRALIVRTQQDFPVEWSATHNNLGNAYWNRIRGDKADNIETAIASYERALVIYTQQYFPEKWAMTQHNLGSAYSDRIRGNKADNIETAIASYERALIIYTQQDFPVEWAATHNNLGNAYSDRIRENKADNIETAISFCKKALIVCTQQDFPVEWAATHNNLGNAYWNRIKGNKANNIETAIASYERALVIYTRRDFPIGWAMTQHNLGNAYRDRIREDKADNIETAIASFKRALIIYTQRDFPIDWAMTQLNLGNAYWNRIKGNKANNIETAIASFERALVVYTQQDFPIDWTATYNNLGNAYSHRIRGNKADNIETAIASYERALIIRTQQDFPVEWAMTQLNLGNAYRGRIRGDKPNNIETAIASFERALVVYTQQDFPIDWAATYNNLGNAYKDRIKGDQAENLEKAIAFFKRALIVYTRQDFAEKWAMTNNNLGNAYRNRIKGDQAENLERAITAYAKALIIYTPQSDPINCLQSANNLGNLHFFNRGNWQSAINAYSLAIEAVEQSREAASNDENKQEIISNAISVYQNIVQAHINLGQIDKAIEYVERGKARNLVELLATRDLYPNGDIPPEIITRLDDLRQSAIAEERRLRQQGNSKGGFDRSSKDNRTLATGTSNNTALDRTSLDQIRQELDNLIAEHISEKDPSFRLTQKVEPISFNKIREALPTKQTALVEWYVGKGTLSAFIVTSQKSIPFHLGYTEEQFQTLLDTVNQYYGLYRQRDSQWRDNLSQLLTELAQNLQLEVIIDRLKQLVPDCNQLILIPHRWLHLLPIHALPLNDGKCLLDIFPNGVSYAPSAQLLELTQKQSKPQLTNLFAVQDPTEDLDFTNIEVEAVRSGFRPNDDVLVNQQASKSALTKERLAEANLTHFSCHGYFNFENPELSALLLAGSKKEGKQQQEEKGEIRFLPSREGGSIDLEKCLTLGEIFSLDLRNCRLVTLSACETGITDLRSLSDEYIGLPSGFLYAGSPSVVSSLWTVSDLSTTFLMIKFYQNLKSIDSVAVALNQAQLWLRNLESEEFEEWSQDIPLTGEQRAYLDLSFMQDSRPFASPYHWGAFCAVGS